MSTRSLPSRPSLDQLKLQAKELRRAHAAGDPSAAERVLAQHPGRRDRSAVNARLTVTDAQLVIAREYGFPSWAKLKHHVELASRIATFQPHPRFDEALGALDAGDADRLRRLLAQDSSLVHARTNLDPSHGYFGAATLLHHVAGNPGRDQPLPDNIVEIARILLDAGADVNAETIGPNGGTTMGLLVTSHQASRRGFSGPLMDVLLEHGAKLDLHGPGALDGSLTNHAPAAALKMIELGAMPDVLAAAALGRMDLLRGFFDDEGRLLKRPRRHARTMSERDTIGLAHLFAYVNGKPDAVDFLLEKDGNWDMIGVNNGTALHRAAWAGDIAMIERLVARCADIGNRDNPFTSTPLSWAQHNRQHETVQWFRTHCAIDIHDAVCLDFPEHVEARLREDPDCVNRRIDQWDIPRATPLHWAAWTHISDVEGDHDIDDGARATVVQLLLDRGADADLIAGNGLTALDIADAAGAVPIVALLEQRGARRAKDLRP
jgi:ankyrin repeat protein